MLKKIISLLFIVFAFSCTGQNYKIEDQLIQCLYETSNNIGIDFKKELLRYEKHLIKTGVLNDNSGKSYYEIYEEIEKTGDVNFFSDYSLIDTLRLKTDSLNIQNIIFEGLKLSEKIKDSEDYKKSNLYKLSCVMDSINNLNNINASVIAKAIIKILSPEDFQHDYYKMTTLWTFSKIFGSDSGMLREFPVIENKQDSAKINPQNILTIHLTAEDSVLVDNKNIPVEELAVLIKSYVLNKRTDKKNIETELVNIHLIGDVLRSKLVISFQTNRNTKYSTYMEVLNELIRAYNELRDEAAQKYFKNKFDDLDSEQKDAIIKLIPKNITETEPN